MNNISIPSHELTIDLETGTGEKELARDIVYVHEDLETRLQETMERFGITLKDINIEEL